MVAGCDWHDGIMALCINDVLALQNALMAAFIRMTSLNDWLALSDGFMAVSQECLVVKLRALLAIIIGDEAAKGCNRWALNK